MAQFRSKSSGKPGSRQVWGQRPGQPDELLIQGGITMKITVTGKNIAVNDKINDAIDKKFAKIGKFFADDIQAKVLMHPEKAKVKVEATISGKGNIFRAESVAQDVFDAIDDVAEKLLKQMSKYKKKLIKKNQGKESVRFEMIPEVPEAEEETKIARTKKFTLTPMTAEEAILQMELLQHNFFVFLDAESGNVNVVYKRNDEDYGLLETEH
jgi:putative sigma-54 modulation protein